MSMHQKSLEDYIPSDKIMLLSILNQKEINYDKDVVYNKLPIYEISSRELETFSFGLLLSLLNKEIICFYRDLETFNDKLSSTKEEKSLDNLFFNLEKQLEYNYSNQLADIQTNSHQGIKHIDETDMIDKSMAKALNDNSSAFKLIIDYNDLVLRTNLENRIENELIAEKEKSLFIFSQIPGVNRHLMETPPPKEENFRKALKCEIYPFITDKLSIQLYEKFISIQTFEYMLSKAFPERDSLSLGDRVFTEVMNKDILSQVLLRANYYDTEVLPMYNERDHSIYLSYYYRYPKGRV